MRDSLEENKNLFENFTVILMSSEARAYARFVKISPFKVRRVIDQIRGRSFEEALMILGFMPYRACDPVLKVLRSAVSNAKNNLGLSKSSLFITEIRADEGPILKRFRPRAQGRGFRIRKPTCHISVVVSKKD